VARARGGEQGRLSRVTLGMAGPVPLDQFTILSNRELLSIPLLSAIPDGKVVSTFPAIALEREP
jgi:hypothetical protein